MTEEIANQKLQASPAGETMNKQTQTQGLYSSPAGTFLKDRVQTTEKIKGLPHTNKRSCNQKLHAS